MRFQLKWLNARNFVKHQRFERSLYHSLCKRIWPAKSAQNNVLDNISCSKSIQNVNCKSCKSSPFDRRPKIFCNILEAIGCTPMVRLNRIPQCEGIECEMYAKCEFLNPGGSSKDRSCYRMVKDAMDEGIVKPGHTLIEPSSGNTAIALAISSILFDTKCIITMPDKMSDEKENTLHILGAKVYRTPSEAEHDSPEGMKGKADQLEKEIPNSVCLDQFNNMSNFKAHYEDTGTEILYQLDDQVDMVVISAGSGGTLSGVSKCVKEVCPDCISVGVDPYGSTLARPESLNKGGLCFFEVEGIGYKHTPGIMDYSVIDKWIKVSDKESFVMARRLIREEGLLCGGSSGSAMVGALKAAQDLKKGQKCVVVLPDGIRNYMTKFVTDNWMEARDYFSVRNKYSLCWWDDAVSELNLKPPETFSENTSCEDALTYMEENDVTEIPILKDDGIILGAVTLPMLTQQMVGKNMQLSDPIKKAIYKRFVKVDEKTNLGKVGRIVETEGFVFVVAPIKGTDITDKKNLKISGIVTQKDILHYILHKI